MDLSGFDESAQVTPLLVRLYDSHRLYGLVKDNKPAARAELTSAVVELLEKNLTTREQELLTDVLIGLMRQAEKDLRLALAEKLATIPNVPLRLILHLANDEITIAAPVLRNSLVLTDLDLIYIVKSQGPDYWQAIAARGGISNEVVNMLADTRDVGTAVVLTQNERIRLTKYAVEVLSEMAEKHDAVAKPLLQRPEVPKDLAHRLYSHVGKELQDYIDAFFKTGKGETAAPQDDLFIEFSDSASEPEARPEFMPSPEVIAAAEHKAELNHLTMDVLMDTLNQGDIPGFIAQFAAYTGITAKKIHDFLRQSCPKGMAIACRAHCVQKTDFARIYLLTHRMRSRHRMVNHKDLLDVLHYFDKARPEVAQRIVRRAGGAAIN